MLLFHFTSKLLYLKGGTNEAISFFFRIKTKKFALHFISFQLGMITTIVENTSHKQNFILH